MRIGIVLHPYDEDKPAGLARTIFELTKGMIEVDKKNEYVIFLKKKPRKNPELRGGNVRFVVLGEGRFWLEKIKHTPVDVCLFNTPVVPLFFRPRVSVVLALDFAYYHLAPKTLRDQFYKYALFFYNKFSLGRADKIIAISNATKQEIISLFKIKSQKIKVVHCGYKKICDVVEEKVELPQKYFFFAGIFKKRKNIENSVRAFFEFSKKHPEYFFVLAGSGNEKNPYVRSFRNYIKENGLQEKVIFPGHLSDGQLSYAYRRAEALVFPTFIEGFGYPVLEAMDCGIPVITSNQSSLKEIAGDAALLVDPHNPKAIAHAMERLFLEEGLRQNLVEKGFSNIKKFSWHKAGREMLKEISKLNV